MDPDGKIYLAEVVAAQDKARLHQQIREWYATLRAGGSVGAFERGDPATSLVLATVRYLNGLGVDQTDPNGEQAMAEVRVALDADRPALTLKIIDEG